MFLVASDRNKLIAEHRNVAEYRNVLVGDLQNSRTLLNRARFILLIYLPIL